MFADLQKAPPLYMSLVTLITASLVILASAWGFEIFGGYAPCPLCLKQRWAYYFAIASLVPALLLYRHDYKIAVYIILAAVVLAFIANSIFGVYHSGIEWKWWDGPASCAGGGDVGGGASGILEKLKTTRFIRCDEAPWRFLGISFAGYNAIFSALLAGIGAYGLFGRKD